MSELEEPTSTGTSRRTVTKAIAWSVPVIALAATVPAAAASEIVTVSQAGDACKLPGNSCNNAGYSKGYLQPLTICNNSATSSITVTIVQPSTLTFNGVPTQFTPVPASFTVAAGGGCQRVILNLNLQDNSQNSSITGSLSYTWTENGGTNQSGTGVVPISTQSTPPCVNCTV